MNTEAHNQYGIGTVCKVRANTVPENYLLGEIVRNDGSSGIYVRVLQDYHSPSVLEDRTIQVDAKNISLEI